MGHKIRSVDKQHEKAYLCSYKGRNSQSDRKENHDSNKRRVMLYISAKCNTNIVKIYPIKLKVLLSIRKGFMAKS